MDLGPHAAFIIGAYAAVAVGIALLIGATYLEARRTARRLGDLEARGIRRRSADPKP